MFCYVLFYLQDKNVLWYCMYPAEQIFVWQKTRYSILILKGDVRT
jgi:hypothetical protein